GFLWPMSGPGDLPASDRPPHPAARPAPRRRYATTARLTCSPAAATDTRVVAGAESGAMGYFLGIDVDASRTVAAVARPGTAVETVGLGTGSAGDGVATVLHLG